MTEKKGSFPRSDWRSVCRSLQTALRERELFLQQTRCFIFVILVLLHSCLGVALTELLPPPRHQVLQGLPLMLKARVCWAWNSPQQSSSLLSPWQSQLKEQPTAQDTAITQLCTQLQQSGMGEHRYHPSLRVLGGEGSCYFACSASCIHCTEQVHWWWSRKLPFSWRKKLPRSQLAFAHYFTRQETSSSQCTKMCSVIR